MSKISLRKHKDSWMYDVHHEVVGRKRKYGFKTKKEANTAALELIKKLDDTELIDTNITFVNYFKTWIKVHKEGQVSKAHLNQHYRTLDVFVEKYGERRLLNQITRNDVQLLLNEYGKGRTHETVRKLKQCLSVPLKDAVYEGYIKKDPTYNLKINATKETMKEHDKFLSIDEYLKLIEFFKSKQHKSYLLLFILAITGARFSEINNMTYDDINHKLNKAWLPGTKTETSAREVSITPKDFSYIKQVLKTYPTKLNKKPFELSNAAVLKTYRLGLKTIGSDSNTTTYALRHTHASFLIANQFDITYISKRLGHSNPNTTLKIYSHLLKEQENAQDEKLATIWRQ